MERDEPPRLAQPQAGLAVSEGEVVTAPPFDSGEERDTIVRRLIDAHLGRAIAGMAFGFGALKVLAVAHFDPTTAMALVSEGATGTLVVGTILLNLGVMVLATAAVSIYIVDKGDVTPAATRLFRFVGTAMTGMVLLLMPIYAAVPFVLTAWFSLNLAGTSRLFGRLAGGKRFVKEFTEHERRADELNSQGAEVQSELEEVVASLEEYTELMTAEVAVAVTDGEELGEGYAALKERYESARNRYGAVKKKVDAQLEECNEELKYLKQRRDALDSKIKWLRWARPRRLGPVMYTATFPMLAWASFLLLVALLDTRPWLPAERVIFDGVSPVTGYVLKARPEEAVLLVARPRRVERYEARVRDRTICREGPQPKGLGRSLVSFVYRSPSYPECRRLGP